MESESKEPKYRMYSFFVLYFLSEQGELSGYDLANTIKSRTHGYFSSTFGNIYPTLKNLEKNELIRSKVSIGKRKKILYAITPKGKTALVELARRYKERFEKITYFFDKILQDANK